MENKTIKELFERKSVRVYEKREIEPEKKKLILEAAIQAPTAGNTALYSIIDVTDQAVKDRLAITCDNQPFIGKAPMVLIFVADYQKWYDSFVACYGGDVRKPSYGDYILACADALIAAQNAVVAAEALGIGSCYIGDVLENFEIHKDLLELPRYAAPIAMLCFGYATEQQKNRKKPQRFDLEYMVSENSYKRRSIEDIREAFSQKEGREGNGRSAEDVVKDIYTRKWTGDFTEEMTRSEKCWLDRWVGEPGKQEDA